MNLEPDWAACEAIARQHGRTFFFASRCLPPAQRQAVLAVYAFCRIADDIVDTADQTGWEPAAIALGSWRSQIEKPVHPVAIAFAHTRNRYGISAEPIHDLITGVGMDLATARYQSWEDLREYCYLVAGTVGLMVAPIMGCRNPASLANAAELGIAMQLTNILRDVGEDAKLDRLYLPLDEIEDFGCDPEALLAGRREPGFSQLMRFQIARARALYIQAEAGLPSLDATGRFTTLVASRLYARILTEIEHNRYDVFSKRAHSSTIRKFMTLPSITARFAQISLLPSRSVPVSPTPIHGVSSSERSLYG